MDKQQKTLKSPLRAKNSKWKPFTSVKCPNCGEPATEMFRLELKAEIAGDAQRSVAKEILPGIEYAIIQARDSQESQIALERKLVELKKLLHDFLKKPL